MSRIAATLFAAFALLAATLHPGAIDNVDSRIMLRTAERLVDEGTWTLGDVDGTYMAHAEYTVRGDDGAHRMKFAPGTALLDIPFLVAGRAVLGAVGLDRARAGEAGVAFASALWYAACAVLVFRIGRRVAGPRVGVLAAVLHGVASYAIVYGRSAYLETPETALVLLAFDAALAARDDPSRRSSAWILGAAAGALLWVKLAGAVLLLGIVCILVLPPARARRDAFRTPLRAGVPAALLVAGLLAVNHARFGSAFESGYSSYLRFDHDLLRGLSDLFFSQEGGLLFFAPLALVGMAGLPALARRDVGLAWGIAIATAAALVLYAKWTSPLGGDAWGPRYLLPNVALLAVPAAVTIDAAFARGSALRIAAATAIGLACALQVAPCLVGFPEVWTIVRRADVPPRMGLLAAGILREKIVPPDGYDLGRLGGPSRTWHPPEEQKGVDLWPVRVARQLPQRTAFGWLAWGVLLAATVGAWTALMHTARKLPA